MAGLRPAARYCSALEGHVRCELCPHRCAIAEGRTGICRTRRNQGGILTLPFFGELSSISSDPIEKKPLYHFYPGSTILSVGFVGCSLRCGFCQNHTISQRTDVPTRHLSPEELMERAQGEGSFAIAYTYSEPLIHFEYVLACCRLAHEAGLKNVLVTNGHINDEPARELLPLVDAANVDLKSFSDEWYRTELGGNLEAVKHFIELAVGEIVLEVTTLVVPGANDSPEEIEAIARWIAALDGATPYHLSCYFPQYRYSDPPTRPEDVVELAAVARRHLSHVYPGNVGLREITTSCPSCGTTLIRRSGYSIRVENVRPGLEGGVCASCGTDPRIPGLL